MLCSFSECQCHHLKKKWHYEYLLAGLLWGFRNNRYKAPGTEGNQYTSHPSLPLMIMWWWLDKLSPWGQGLCLLTLAPLFHHLVTWWKYSIRYLFDEFFKSKHLLPFDRQKEGLWSSGLWKEMPSPPLTGHVILATLEGTWLCLAAHIWTPFHLGGIPSLIRSWSSLSEEHFLS